LQYIPTLEQPIPETYVKDVDNEMPNYAVTFEMEITETVMVMADSAKEAEKFAREEGWAWLSQGNWDITKQYEYAEEAEAYCTKCLAEFGVDRRNIAFIVVQDECISCQTFEAIEGGQNES